MTRAANAIAAVIAAVAFAASASASDAQSSPSTAASPAAGQASTIQPGIYDLEIAVGGGILEGTLKIAMVGDSTDAKLAVGEHAPPIQLVTRKGSRLTLSGKGEGVDVVYELQFTGEALLGTFTFNGDSGTVTGKRRR